MSRTAVFVNPRARKGRGAARAEHALEALRGLAGEHEPELIGAASVLEVRQQTRRLVEEGCERIVVLGGDGLVHHVVQSIAGSETVLGLIPVGSGNDFASALGLATNPAEAARVAMGPARTIDLLRREDSEGTTRWAASVATVGFSAAVNERAEALAWPRGGARYSLATLLELPRLACRSLVLDLYHADGSTEQRRVRAALVAVANTACFGGGMRICPAAVPDDALLDVTVIGAVGRISLLRHFGRVFRGTHVTHPAVTTYQLTAISLSADPNDPTEPADPTGRDGAVRADGEGWARLPLRIDIVPAALRIAAPPPLS